MAASNINAVRITGNSHQQVLECGVCDEVFSAHGDKIPRLLLCGHTVCHDCLTHLVPRGPGRHNLCCPFDRQATQLGESGVWGLKKNFALLDLLERLDVPLETTSCTGRKNSSSVAGAVATSSNDHEERVCCDEDECHSATVYCTVCSTNLCAACSTASHSTRTLAKHKRVPLGEKPPKQNPACPQHPSHALEFVCLEKACQAGGPSALMCCICRDYGPHVGHGHLLIHGEAENVRSSLVSAAQQINGFVAEMSDLMQRLSVTIEQVEGSSGTATAPQGNFGTLELAQSRVRAYFSGLHETLYRQEEVAVSVIDAHVRDRLGTLYQQQDEVSLLIMDASTISQRCQKTATKDDVRVMAAKQEVNELLEAVQRQQQRFSELTEIVMLDSSIPLTITKDNRAHIGRKLEVRVVTLGLDQAGKSSILFKLKQNEFIQTIPTIGFNVETIEYKNLKFTIWDVGGDPKLRPLWKHYYLNTQAVVFVVDSSDANRVAEAHGQLSKLMSEKTLRDALLLVFANKQDQPGAVGVEQMSSDLSLHKICCGRSWHIQGCSAKTGAGLVDGLEWLSQQLVAAGVLDIAVD